jgi:hypothetical protein
MKNLKIIVTSLILMSLFACAKKEKDDSATVGAAYCECMKEHGAPANYEYATMVCDGEFVKKSRLYRLYRIEWKYDWLQKKMPVATKDSAELFAKQFEQYTHSHCCDIVNNCKEPTVKH